MANWFTLLQPYVPIPLRALRPTLLKDNARENEEGGWKRLRGPTELGRYGVIHDFCQFFAPGGAVLDVGCADGLLQERLMYGRYLGIDGYAPNIERASRKADERTRFVHADATTFVPEGRFDAIVWNETLYYLERPLDSLQRYCEFLAPGGVMIVSMYFQTFATRQLFRRLRRIGTTLADVRLSQPSGESWVVRAYDASAHGTRRDTLTEGRSESSHWAASEGPSALAARALPAATRRPGTP